MSGGNFTNFDDTVPFCMHIWVNISLFFKILVWFHNP